MTQPTHDWGELRFSSGARAIFAGTLWNPDGTLYVLDPADVLAFEIWLKNASEPVLRAASNVVAIGVSLLLITDLGNAGASTPAAFRVELDASETRLRPGAYYGRLIAYTDGSDEPQVAARGRVYVLSSPL